MKKLILSIIVVLASMSLALAQTPVHPGCAVALDGPVKTVVVEQRHIVDVCLQDANLKIDRVVLGDGPNWRVDVGSSRDIAYITPLESSGGTNALIYLKGEPEARYELRLRAVKMLPK